MLALKNQCIIGQRACLLGSIRLCLGWGLCFGFLFVLLVGDWAYVLLIF